MPERKEKLVYLANGLVEGVLIPESERLISTAGVEYPCTISPKLKAWYRLHPEQAASARAFVVYPRTIKGAGLQFHVVGAPKLDQEAIKRGSGVFRVQGVVTNLRGEKNRTVVRIKRNGTPSLADRKKHAWTQHLIFLTGRVTPSELFVGNFVNFTCRLEGHDLKIQGAHPIGGPSLEWIHFGAAYLPWPFNPRKTSTWAQFRRKNTTADAFPFISNQPLKEVLSERLAALHKLVSRLKKSERFKTDATFNRDVDRLRLVHQRLETFVSKTATSALMGAVEKEGLLRLLNLVLEPTAEEPVPVESSTPKAKSKPPAQPVKTAQPKLSPLHQKIHQAMAIGMLDERIMVSLDVGRDALRDAIAAMDAADMLDDGSLRASRSYQLKRYRKQKSEAAAQPAVV